MLCDLEMCGPENCVTLKYCEDLKARVYWRFLVFELQYTHNPPPKSPPRKSKVIHPTCTKETNRVFQVKEVHTKGRRAFWFDYFRKAHAN